jgi:SagB-type dehydrogenase family enzyme
MAHDVPKSTRRRHVVRRTGAIPTFRRSPALICYWQDGALLLENYARREKTEATPLVLEVLDALTDWQPASALHARLKKIPPALIDDLLAALVTHGLIDRDEHERADGGRTAALEAWKSWTPAATYFHLATKDVPFTPREETNRTLKKRAIDTPPPPHLKESAATVRIALPAPAAPATPATSTVPTVPATSETSTADRFQSVLTERRTWRRFGTRAISLDELGTLLGMTFGVQDWIEVEGWGRMPLKTAPSGGARHSIEAYVLVRHVSGLKPGLYHYQPAAHELHPIRTKPAAGAAADIRAYLPRQGWYGSASALILMTAVFPRVQWRYPFARAYRTVIAEAGHHCQNVCLVATWLGLAPFCTMALADSRIEKDLGIDGLSESVIYAAGVGPRPKDVAWAPWPDTPKTPARAANQPERERTPAPSAPSPESSRKRRR